MYALIFLSALLSAGCPGPVTRPSPAQPVATAAGCPAAEGVQIASYLSNDPSGGTAPHVGWVLPLHDAVVDSVAGLPEYTQIDAATASARGVPPAPSDVWLAVPGQPACKATVGSYYAAAVAGPPANVTYGVELAGCSAPPAEQQDEVESVALLSAAPPADCQILAPQPVAARVGQTDAQNHWQRPTKETPIPPAVAAILPRHDCTPPGCETLWAFGEVAFAGRPVAWAGAVNWLTIPPGAPPESQCDWKADTFAGFFAATADGRAVQITSGQDHPLLLTAVLADARGPRALLAEGPGEYAVYDLTAGAQLARHLVWLRLPADAYAIDERIGPSCGRDQPR